MAVRIENLPDVRTRPLRRARDAGEWAILRAALEWSLVDPIVIEDRDDLRSRPRWRDRVEPFHHQVDNLLTFCRRLPVTLLADDVGLGKTISAGLVASELVARRRVRRVLVVAPRLLGPQWKEELEARFGIPAVVATGRALVDAVPGDGNEVGAVVTTYHSARDHLARIPADRFEMLVLDEAHKLRNLHGVPEPPRLATRLREVLAERRFRFVLMLTATPIHNRLWDIYSLVELLAVARGHRNPFGDEAAFAREFIADHRAQARQLREDAKQRFRSIVYGYMSRVRRADARLHFPDRHVVRRGVPPTPGELALIGLVAGPVQELNALAQSSILQALASSPEACAAQLDRMARNGTFPADVAAAFRARAQAIGTTAKLAGLLAIVEELRREKPADWRLVVFTQRRETQASIVARLRAQGIAVGVVNGDTAGRNEETLAAFRASPPRVNAIVSTEAGSEGVNLQVANVLVNYDLPWNPMVVEQRIGRVQRLGSPHASVVVHGITLAGTFEEHIVGRLMQKLQMASQAIGDIDSLLEASGLGGGEDGGAEGFEEEIRRLVLASLAGRDVAAATRAAEESIERARQALATEEAAIDGMLGAMDATAAQGPRGPSLPPPARSMPARDFALAALRLLGARIEELSSGDVACAFEGRSEVLRLGDAPAGDARVVACTPGTPAFERIVARVAASGLLEVADDDAGTDPRARLEEICTAWLRGFGGSLRALRVAGVARAFDGEVLVQARATVAHDAYECVVPVACAAATHVAQGGPDWLDALPPVVADPGAIGVSLAAVARDVARDQGIAEFRRFYDERRARELPGAGGDARLARKLEEDFTPRLDASVAAIRGRVHRVVEARLSYVLADGQDCASTIRVAPSSPATLQAPALASCARSGTRVPADALATCAVSGLRVMPGLLVASEESGQRALPEHAGRCSVTSRRALSTELEACAASGRLALRRLLVPSSVSGRRCLAEEAIASRAGRHCLPAEATRCAWSGRMLHPDDARACALTGLAIDAGLSARDAAPALAPLLDLLEGRGEGAERREEWPAIERRAAAVAGGRCVVKAALASPDGSVVAAFVEQKTLLGLRTRRLGLVWSPERAAILGQVAIGRQAPEGWRASA